MLTDFFFLRTVLLSQPPGIVEKFCIAHNNRLKLNYSSDRVEISKLLMKCYIQLLNNLTTRLFLFLQPTPECHNEIVKSNITSQVTKCISFSRSQLLQLFKRDIGNTNTVQQRIRLWSLQVINVQAVRFKKTQFSFMQVVKVRQLF